MRLFGKDDERQMPGALRGFVEAQEKDNAIDEFFREEFDDDDEVKKKI